MSPIHGMMPSRSKGMRALQKIQIIGAGAQGKVWAKNLTEGGMDVHVFVRRPKILGAELACHVHSLSDLTEHIQPVSSPIVVALLIPDEAHMAVIEKYLCLKKSIFVVFAHGYTPTYEKLPANITPVLCAPKLIGLRLRERFLKGQPVPIMDKLLKLSRLHDILPLKWGLKKTHCSP